MDQYVLRPSNPLRTPSTARGMTPSSPQERPGSSGYAEPKTRYLLQALSERRGVFTPQPPALQLSQSTPQRPTPSRRLSTGRGTPFRDEWTTAAAAADSDQGVQRSHSTGPRVRGRRLSESATGRTGDTPKAGLTIKESNVLIDRLQKENFDLKLRMTLQDEKVKRMARELEDKQERVAMADALAERCASAEEKAAQLEDQLEQVRARFEETWSHNQELAGLSDELARELEAREHSIDEAADIIHDLEERIYELEKAQTPVAKSPLAPPVASSHPDSDYFSGEAESPVVLATKPKARPGSSSSSSVMPADSDYYSATSYSSPASAAPKRARPVSRRFKTSPADVAPPSAAATATATAAAAAAAANAGAAAPPPRRRSNSDKVGQVPQPLDLDTVHPYDGRRSSTVKPTTALQPAASIQSSPDPPAPRPGLRRTRKVQNAAIYSLRLQAGQHQQHSADPATPRPAFPQPPIATPGSAPAPSNLHANAAAPRRTMLHSVTPSQHIPRASSEPPHAWTKAPALTLAPELGPTPAPAALVAAAGAVSAPRPLQSLYMTGELSRPVTADTHNRYGDAHPLRVPGQAPAEATPTVLSPAATPANDHEDGTDASVATSTSRGADSGEMARPIIWRDRSNMSSLALAATNATATASARILHGLPRDGEDDDDDQLAPSEADSGSPTATIPETISSEVDVAARRRAQRLRELGSEYGSSSVLTVTTARDGGAGAGGAPYGGWPEARSFGRDVLFRP